MNEHGDMKIPNYVVFPRELAAILSRSLILDVTITHDRYGHSILHTNGNLTDSIPVVVNTSGRIYEDFLRLIFFHTNRESSCFSGELVEVSDQFRFSALTV